MKKALQIAINNYPESPLNGCVPDLVLMNKVLKEKYGFSSFRILTDKQATKKNIIEGLKWLAYGSKKEDQLVVTYSGHGTQVPVNDKTYSSDSLDQMDECWVTYDHDWDDPLRDDNLNELLKNLVSDVLVISDSCFSGTMLRNCFPMTVSDKALYRKNRYLPPPPSLVLPFSELSLDDELNLLTSRSSSDSRTRLKPFIVKTADQGNCVLISGCSDRQTSADTYISQLNRYHGALTYYLVEVLKSSKWKITYEDLVIKTESLLKANQYEQTPQCEAKPELLKKLFLGGK
jgi:hypothetical protein